MDEELEGLVVEPWELDVAEVLEEVVEVTVKGAVTLLVLLEDEGGTAGGAGGSG